MWSLVVACVALVCSALSANAASHGTPWANTGSPLGVNLSQPAFSGNGQAAFANLLKSGGNWITTTTATVCATDTGDEAILYNNANGYLDANGYPVSLNGAAHGGTFTAVCTTMNQSLTTPYPSGNYRFTFNGGGGGAQVVFGGDASSTTCTTSPCTVPVTAASSGIQISFRGITSSGNAITNAAFVYSGNTAAYDAAGCTTQGTISKAGCFDPNFLTKLAPFSTLRFMQAQDTLSNTVTSWANRAQLSYVFWNFGDGFNAPASLTNAGWPLEVVFGLCNTLNADCWVNIPCLADSTFNTNMATLGHSMLNVNLKVYVENCNEIWNQAQLSAGVQNGMIAAGHTAFPGPPTPSDIQALYFYGVSQGITYGNAWKSIWGADSARVIRVFGGFAGNDGGWNQFWLPLTAPQFGGGTWSGTIASNVDAMATAPYYDAKPPAAITAFADGGLSWFFCMVSGGTITPTPNCNIPSGVSANTTTGTSTAYVLSDGAGTGCPAAVNTNGYVTTVIFNQTFGSNPTLAVDGCAAAPILCDDVNSAVGAAGNTLCSSAGAVPAGDTFNLSKPYTIAYTTATSAGSVTTSWRLMCGAGVNCYGETVPRVLSEEISANLSTATNPSFGNGIELILYEGGWGFVSTVNSDVWGTLYNTASSDPRAYQTTTLLMDGLRTLGLNGVFVYYSGIGQPGFRGENWGLWNSVYQAPDPPKALEAYDYIRRNPCWWTLPGGTSCRH